VRTLTAREMDQAVADMGRDGFAVLSALVEPGEVAAVVAEMEHAQYLAMTGGLDRRHCGGEVYTSGDSPSHPHYILDVARYSPLVDDLFHNPQVLTVLSGCLGGAEPWEFPEEYGQEFGVVYQDCRVGPDSSYSRIGWHTDHQAYPTSDFFPSVAVTVNLDPTSPANGFLRVVPGSHQGGTDGIPPGFEKVDGEIGVYCGAGDVLLHHCDLWHSAARGTEDPPGGLRRHLRGSFHAGRRPTRGQVIEPFNKNARR